MSFTDEWDVYYTDNEQDENMIDIIYIHKNKKEYFVHTNAFDYEIDGCDEDDNEIYSTYVSRFVYNTLLDQCKRIYKVSDSLDEEYDNDKSCNNGQISIYDTNSNRILRDKIWQGINGELDEEELESITRHNHQRDDYFNLDICKNMIYKYLNNTITPEYFTTWCAFMANLHLAPNNANSKTLDIIESISELFDSSAFWEYDIDSDEKIRNCKELIAELKWKNHCLINAKTDSNKLFDNKGFLVYVSFDHFNEITGPVHRMCIVDIRRKKFNLLYVDNLEFDENINYIFCNSEDFDNLSSIYYSYKEDRYFQIEEILNQLNK